MCSFVLSDEAVFVILKTAGSCFRVMTAITLKAFFAATSLAIVTSRLHVFEKSRLVPSVWYWVGRILDAKLFRHL